MQILDLESVKQQLNMPMAIEAIEKLLKVQHEHSSWVKSPERLVIPTFNNIENDSVNHQTGSHLSMPSVVYDGDKEYAVVKLVSICPDNPKRDLPTTVATITVSDNATGETLAFMDGIYVTQVRTAALSGVATKHMANPNSEKVAVLGTGGMAFEQLNAVLTVCPYIKQVTLWNRTVESAEVFKTKFNQDYPQWQDDGIDIRVIDNKDEALKDADIINLATRATEGLFEVSQIKPNAHINAVGAYQPHMKEVSDSVIANCAHVVIDDLEGGKHEAGDLIQAHDNDECEWSWKDLAGELIDLVSGELKMDNSSEQKGITLFKSVGTASFDAAVAIKVAQAAQRDNLGLTADL